MKRGVQRKKGTRALSSRFLDKQLVNSKRSQVMQLPFGMIFSIILIIVFIVVAIYVISIFLGWKKCAETGLFKQDFQEEIDRAWNSEDVSVTFTESLPSDIKEICFIDAYAAMKGKKANYYSDFQLYESENHNMFFWPLEKACEGQRSFEIMHLDIEKITEKENPYCIENKGKVEIKINKGFYDSSVNIS